MWGYDRELNDSLRGFDTHPSCTELGGMLERALLKLPASEGVVYRGVTMWNELNDIKVGKCFSDKGFSSTSRKRSVAAKFSANIQEYITETSQPALLIIRTSTGREISHLSSDTKGESEVLLFPRTSLKLISRKLDKENVMILKFNEVSSKQCH